MTSREAHGFLHLYTKRSGPRTLLLLHGTGGDERDLLPLADYLDPSAHILSPRGNVTEGGMPRFFARLRPGVFDTDEVRTRAAELASFVPAAAGDFHVTTVNFDADSFIRGIGDGNDSAILTVGIDRRCHLIFASSEDS